MNGHVNVKNVIFNAHENKVLFHIIIYQGITDKDLYHVKIYDPNKQDFIDSTFLYNERCKVIISYVNHNEHQDGVIICFYPGKNEISSFLNTKSVGFNSFRRREFSFDAFERDKYLCVSNLSNQILILQWQCNENHFLTF